MTRQTTANLANHDPANFRDDGHFNEDGLRAFCALCRQGLPRTKIADALGIWYSNAHRRYVQWQAGRLAEYE